MTEPPVSAELVSAARGGRRQRMSLQEVERRVIAKARELLIGQQGGLTVSLEHVNLEVIIAAAGVPRSSAHRRWPTKDEFVVDFLCDVAGPHWAGTAAFDPETIRVAVRTAQENAELLGSAPDAATLARNRRKLLREVVRVAARQNFNAILSSSEWRTYVALTATVVSMSDTAAQARIQQNLRLSENTFIDRMTTFYSNMASFLAFKPRSPYTFRHLAAAGAAIVEGLALRHLLGIEVVDAPLHLPDDDGGGTEWALAAAGFLAVLDSMTEMDTESPPLSPEEVEWFRTASIDELIAVVAPDLADKDSGMSDDGSSA
jgi:AcrR family transcriptional regulator